MPVLPLERNPTSVIVTLRVRISVAPRTGIEPAAQGFEFFDLIDFAASKIGEGDPPCPLRVTFE